MSATAQDKPAKVKIDSLGNYVAIGRVIAKSDSPTTKTFTDSKGVVYPVMMTSTGRLVYYRISAKTGVQYKVYIDKK